MNVLHLLSLGTLLWPLVKGWTWLLPALFLGLREAHIQKHLPLAVQKLLNDPTVREMVKAIALRADLDSDAKRAEAAAKIGSYLKGRGIDLPDHLINLVLELVVARLHKEGAL